MLFGLNPLPVKQTSVKKLLLTYHVGRLETKQERTKSTKDYRNGKINRTERAEPRNPETS